jgi:hypothetical protein
MPSIVTRPVIANIVGTIRLKCRTVVLSRQELKYQENPMFRRWPINLVLIVTLLAIASIAFAQSEDNPVANAAAPRARVAHLAPFAAVVEDTAVTVTINGEELLTDFKFTDFTDYVTLDGAGSIDVAVLVGETAVIEETLVVAENTDYTLAAIGEGSNQPIGLWTLVDDNTPPAAGQAHLRIAHAAPFSSNLDDTKVDICTQDGMLVGGLAGVPYQVASGYLPLPAGTYDLKVTLTDPTSCAGLPIIDPDPVTLPDGAVVTVYAYGDAANQSPGLLAVPVGVLEVTPPLVRVVHVAPFAPVIAQTRVNLAVDGQVLPGELKYLENTDYIPLPAAGSYLFEVLAGGATAVSDTVVLGAGVPVTIAAIGDGANQPLEYLVLTDDLMLPDPGYGKIRIAHTAPFAANINDTRVDICTQDGNLVGGLAGVPYGAETGFLTLPANTYDLKITAAAVMACSGDTIIDLPPLELPEGAIVTVFAVGGTNDQMPGAYSPEVGRIGIPYLSYMPLVPFPGTDIPSYEWTKVYDGGNEGWAKRAGLQAVELGNRFYVLGGRTPNPTQFNPFGSILWDDVWESNDLGESWTRIAAGPVANPGNPNPIWAARGYFQAVTKDDAMFVLGGQDFSVRPNPPENCPPQPLPCPPFIPDSTFFNDVWSSTDGTNWEQLTANAPWKERAGLSAIVFDGSIFVIGGGNGDDVAIGGTGRELFNDVWRSSNGINWELVTDNAPWPARAGAAVVEKNGYLYILGGEDGFLCNSESGSLQCPYFNDVWRSHDGASWELVTAAAGWSPRPGHQCQVVQDTIVCFGGFGFPAGDPTVPVHPSDVWASRDGENWAQTSDAPWNASSSADVKYDFDSLVVEGEPDGMGPSIFTFGGDREASFLAPSPMLVDNDVWRFSPPDASK